MAPVSARHFLGKPVAWVQPVPRWGREPGSVECTCAGLLTKAPGRQGLGPIPVDGIFDRDLPLGYNETKKRAVAFKGTLRLLQGAIHHGRRLQSHYQGPAKQ